MANMIKCVIDSVRVSLTNQQRLVVLRDLDSEVYLPIWIGLYEAEAITLALQKIEIARPQTHDLLTSIIKSLDGILLRVEIIELREDVFYAGLVIEQDGIKKRLDCRPSDAIAIAARTSVDILVDEDVLTEAGIKPGAVASDPYDGDESSEPISEDLDVFENFLDNLGKDPNDEDESDSEEQDPKSSEQ
ncbi:MAG: bifunctional nuclease family protein [Anaerolineaceae bacterium]|nr:bifunctional nuclease family protein [Anaerolineaceae bacterium]